MTPWERALARRRKIARRSRWQDRGLDARTARAVEALLNGPRPPRAVSAVAVEDDQAPGGWAVLVQPADGSGHDGQAARLTTLGACTPYLAVAMRAPSGGAWWKRARQAPTDAGDGGAPGPVEVAPPPAAERQVRRELDAATGTTTGQTIAHEQEAFGGATARAHGGRAARAGGAAAGAGPGTEGPVPRTTAGADGRDARPPRSGGHQIRRGSGGPP